MKPIKKRIQLDRTEVLVVLGIMFLVSTLMFSLGVMVGIGLPSGDADSVAHSVQKGQVGVSDKTTASKKAERKESDRRPASAGIERPSKEAPGSELRRAFRESKQRALVDSTLRETPDNAPKSIADSEAHFESHKDWSRSPASTAHTAESGPKNSAAPLKAPGINNVKGLFERRPSSKDSFSPVSGTFTVQIGSFASADESEAKVFELRKSGFNDAYIHTVKTKKGDQWYRVAVGSFAKEQFAKQTGERIIKRKLASDYFVRMVE